MFGLRSLEVRITQQTLNEALDYDSLTGSLTWKVRPRSHFNSDRSHKRFNSTKAGQPAFTSLSCEYLSGKIFNCGIRAHRAIFLMVHGYEATQVDHENGIKTDNRLENLRDATHTQNQRNRKRNLNNKSGVTGVVWKDALQKWEVNIPTDTGRKYLGTFHNFQDAVRVRKEAEKSNGYHQNHGR